MKSSFALTLILSFTCGAFAHRQVTPANEQKDLLVVGLNGQEKHLSVADLDKWAHDKVTLPNEDGTKTTFVGVGLRAILDKLAVPTDRKLRRDALQQIVIVTARDGYSVPFTVAELDPAFGNLRAVLAYRKEGGDMFQYQGPFRLICPTDKAGARSIRMVQSIRVVTMPTEKAGS
jgi:hypothetical protein